ncbi:MAG: GNAT family N-acetyltransferase [Oscillospiraceae bacterium]|nr:GNAT family N-acetyltransferase [Oscillospiraceae bacterium]
MNKIKIYELKNASKSQIGRIARLHMIAFPNFFLTQLGFSFLNTLYTGYAEDEDSGLIVAETKGRIIGFIAYSNDYSKFYKGLIKNHIIKFAACSAVAAVKHPSYIKRLLGAFKKSDAVKKEERYVELASICVDPRIESKGIGTALIDYLKCKVDFSKYAYINLETDAENNDGANHFYRKNGFVITREFKTDEGRKMFEYRWSI